MDDSVDILSVSRPSLTTAGISSRGASAGLLDQILGSCSDGFFAFDTNLRYVYWSGVMERIFGLTASEVLGRSAPQLFPHLIDTGEDTLMLEAVHGRDVVSGENPYVLPHPPRQGFYEARYSPFRDANGAIAGGIGIVRDVTERKRAVDDKGETEERFRTMADCAPVLLWMAGTDSECTYFNQTWLRFTGRSHETERGVGWAEGVHHEDLQYVLDTYMTAFCSRREFEMEYRLRRADGEYRWILDHGAPRYTPEGRFAGYIGSCTDITDRKQAEENLKTVAGRLLRSNEELQRFAYIASHDLQEPLRTIMSYTQLLEKKYTGVHGEEADELVSLTVQEGKRMKLLIDDLLSYSRLEGEDRKRRPVDCGSVLADVMASLRTAMDESGAQIAVEALPTVLGDPLQITQLFQNLISNSIKFRGERAPRIRVSATRRRDEWLFSVADNGIGFEARYADRIFVIFQRLHQRDEFPGNGMGLATCKKIVELQGGRIWAESEPGQGSRFFFTLPDALAGAPEAS